MKKYGVTPWGEIFIEAISRYDENGRLSRGKTYANTGRVLDLRINGAEVEAWVKGRSYSGYSVAIKFKAFTAKEKKHIADIISEDPLILARIINGTLPEELLSLLEENDIDLLPQSWTDMKRKCTCPDWGDPCKHMAAVYYTLTAEIDKNPFAIFLIRGMDLAAEFDIREEILEIAYPVPLEYAEAGTNEQHNTAEVELTRYSDLSPFILSMLAESPPFSDINYREVMGEFYKKSRKNHVTVMYPRGGEDIPRIERILKESAIEFAAEENIYDSYFEIRNELFKDDKEAYRLFEGIAGKQYKDGVAVNSIALLNLFLSFEDDAGTAEYRYLYYLFRAVYLLVEAGGYLPAVLVREKGFQIVYKPAVSIPDVKEQVERLAGIAPLMAKYAGKKKSFTPVTGTLFILTACLTGYVQALEFMHKRRKDNPPEISKTFFRSSLHKTTTFQTKTIPASVNSYFAVFDIVRSDYRYSIYIDKEDIDEIGENEKQYYMSIDAGTEKSKFSLDTAVRKFDPIDILRFLSLITLYLPEIKPLLKEKQTPVGRDRLEEFLLSSSLVLSNLGVEIILPKELKNILRPKAVLTTEKKPGAKSHTSYLTLDKLLKYEWKIAIGDRLVSLEEFERLVAGGRELIEFNEQFVRLSPEEAKRIFADMRKKMTGFDIIQARLNNEILLDKETEKFIDTIFTGKKIAVPGDLNARLRPYQERGYLWGTTNLLNGFGIILADDMGLGKTIQAITIILHLKNSGSLKHQIIIVAPTTLLFNWELELAKFAPRLSCHLYYGPKREMKNDVDIIITTYQLLMRDIKKLQEQKFDCLIIDEAQYIKNPDTKSTKAVKELKVKYKMALSGTPVENNLSELWSIFDFVLPGYLKTLANFKKNYAKDIEISKDREKIKRLRTITSPFMLRRLKTDKSIIEDLPEKTVIDEFATLSKEQAALYQGIIDDNIKKIETLEGVERKGMIFKLITSLKQVCNHPRNFDKTSAVAPEVSGKVMLLFTLLETIMQKNEKVLIFTQYVEMGKILYELIEKELYTVPLYLHGGLSKKKREELIDQFQNDSRHSIFILSLKAAGVGLNLTAASNVIHYDLWYNPAVENQATDRAFRIGQTKDVFVHRFITKNTFEEKIDRMIKAKQELSNLSVNIGEKWLSEMDNDELKNLFS
ncbi:MAG: DEAD/DEAH box helicase family protein [bacterium]|nr:DEAD/DEAH box helicase family protein [bacterium]